MQNNEKYEVVIGTRAVRECFAHSVPIKQISIGNYINLKQNKTIADITKIAKSQNVKITKIDKKDLDRQSEGRSHQGVLAKIMPFSYSSLTNIIDKTINKSKSLIIILDHIEDAGNLGAIIRSAEAFGADGIIIANKRAAGVTATTYKTSAGAILNMSIAKVPNINFAIDQLKNNEFWIACATEHTNKKIWDENLKGKLALVMGAENKGVSSLVLKNSDFHVCLPLSGNVESLNVAQAATACMYEWVRQNN